MLWKSAKPSRNCYPGWSPVRGPFGDGCGRLVRRGASRVRGAGTVSCRTGWRRSMPRRSGQRAMGDRSAVRAGTGLGRGAWRLTPEVGRMVAQPGRNTITRSTVRDRQAVGWRGSPTARSRASSVSPWRPVGRSTSRRPSFATHTNCSVRWPVVGQERPEVPVQAYQASADTSSMSDAQRDAHRARTRAWLNREYPDIRG
jgi:hypothetical protein